MKRQGRGMWLVLAGVLFLLAAWLMFSGQGEEEVAEAPEVNFPRRLRPQEVERVERRRTYVAPPTDAGVATVASEPVAPRDPLLAALPRGPGKTAIVIEANAIRHSPIGELLLECLMNQGGKGLEHFQQETGINPLEDLDRLVITDDGLIVSGNFGNPRFKEMLASRGSVNYGKSANLFELDPGRTREEAHMAARPSLQMGTWNDQMLMFDFKGNGLNGIKDIVDRVEGRGPDEPPVISEGNTYGEMYGVISVEQFRKLVPPEQKELMDRLAQAAQNVELHVDASSDFAMTAKVRGADAALVTDLGKSLGGALSLARMKAQTAGDTELAQMLDFARVRPDGETFGLEVAVPLNVIQQQLAFCREKQGDASPAPR
ncbi:MAG: hypothetical protein ABW123_23670 [Cystobacter sp.]